MSLQALIPGFTTPSVLITNVTASLLEKVPQALGIPAFVIPDSMLNSVNLLLTNLTAVPTIIHDVASQVGNRAAASCVQSLCSKLPGRTRPEGARQLSNAC